MQPASVKGFHAQSAAPRFSRPSHPCALASLGSLRGAVAQAGRSLSSATRFLHGCGRCFVAVDPPAKSLTCWWFSGKRLVFPKCESLQIQPNSSQGCKHRARTPGWDWCLIPHFARSFMSIRGRCFFNTRRCLESPSGRNPAATSTPATPGVLNLNPVWSTPDAIGLDPSRDT